MHRNRFAVASLLPAAALVVTGGITACSVLGGGSEPTAETQEASFMSTHWPGAVVYYAFDDAGDGASLSSTQRTNLVAALGDYQDNTPVRFEPYSSAPAGAEYILYSKYTVPADAGASSYTTPTSYGYQIMLYGPDDRTYRHETGHALGRYHEFQRADRDAHVNYYSACVKSGEQGNFSLKDAGLLSPYDFNSIMDYDTYSMSITPQAVPTDPVDERGCPTLLAIDPANPLYSTYNGPGADGSPISVSTYGDYFGKDPSQALTPEDINITWQMYEQPLGADASGDMFGDQMVVGDFDGDGYDDLAVGVAQKSLDGGATHPGAVYLYKGTYTGLVAWRVLAETDFGVTAGSQDLFGAQMAAGDIDGDGIADLVVGAPWRAIGSATKAGAVFVYSGAQGGPKPMAGGYLTQGGLGIGTDSTGDTFGSALAIGHFDSALHADLAIGAEGKNATAGFVYLLHHAGSFTAWGSPSGVSRAPFATPAVGDNFGEALATVDIDGDGLSDLIVGGAQYTSGSGFVDIFWGEASGPLGADTEIADSHWAGSAMYDGFGMSVAASAAPAGPCTTTRGEIAIGAPNRNGAAGRAMLGSIPCTTGKSASISWSVFGVDRPAGAGYGYPVAFGPWSSSGYQAYVGAYHEGAGKLFVINDGSIVTVTHPTGPWTTQGYFGCAAAGGFFSGHSAVPGLSIGACGDAPPAGSDDGAIYFYANAAAPTLVNDYTQASTYPR